MIRKIFSLYCTLYLFRMSRVSPVQCPVLSGIDTKLTTNLYQISVENWWIFENVTGTPISQYEQQAKDTFLTNREKNTMTSGSDTVSF